MSGALPPATRRGQVSTGTMAFWGLSLMALGLTGIVMLEPNSAGQAPPYMVLAPHQLYQVRQLISQWSQRSPFLRGARHRLAHLAQHGQTRPPEPESTQAGADSQPPADGSPSNRVLPSPPSAQDTTGSDQDHVDRYLSRMKEAERRELERTGASPPQIQKMLNEITSKHEKVKAASQRDCEHRRRVEEGGNNAHPMSTRRIALTQSTTAHDVTATFGNEHHARGSRGGAVSGRIVEPMKTFEDFQAVYRTRLYNLGPGGPQQQAKFQEISTAVVRTKEEMNEVVPVVLRRAFEMAVELERQTVQEELQSRRRAKFEELWSQCTPPEEILAMAAELEEDEFDMLYDFELEHMQERMELTSSVKTEAARFCDASDHDTEVTLRHLEALYEQATTRQRKAMSERMEINKEQIMKGKRRRMKPADEVQAADASLNSKAHTTLGSFEESSRNNKEAILGQMKAQLERLC